MASTTNYSWSTPDDTALVKDGAAAIRSLGSAIDSTVFTNASAAINKTIVDAKGDIIAATAADTVSRLAVGANDTVLMADSTTATGLKWGTVATGGMTLISTTTMSGTSTTVSSIPTTYKNLQLIFRDLKDTGNATRFRIQFNGNTSSVYDGVLMYSDTSTAATGAYSSTGARLNWAQPQDQSSDGFYVINVFDYASTTSNKMFTIQAGYLSTYPYAEFSNYRFRSDTAITSLTIESVNGVSMAGSLLLYGVS